MVDLEVGFGGVLMRPYVDDLLDRYVQPVLAEAGFRRRALRFWRVTEAGEQIVVQFRQEHSGDKAGFQLEYWLVPAGIFEFHGASPKRRVAPVEWASVYGLMAAQLQWRRFPEMSSEWRFRPDQVDELGDDLAGYLRGVAVPWWDALLGSQSLLSGLARDRSVSHTVLRIPSQLLSVLYRLGSEEPATLAFELDSVDDEFKENWPSLFEYLQEKVEERARSGGCGASPE